MSYKLPTIPSTSDPLRPTRIFLDTEFTEFGVPGRSSARLISIALVDESGNTFYGESDGWELADSSLFVQDNVASLLSGNREPIRSLAKRLFSYLAKYDYAVIHCDYHGDWDWFLHVLSFGGEDGTIWPNCLHHEPYYVEPRYWCAGPRKIFETALNTWFGTHPRHHALNDAVGLCYAWLKTREFFDWVEDPGSVEIACCT